MAPRKANDEAAEAPEVETPQTETPETPEVEQTRAEALANLIEPAEDVTEESEPETPEFEAVGEPVKWDGDVEYGVIGGGFTAVVDGNHCFARTGTVLLLDEKTGDRGVDLGVLTKV